MAEKKTVVDVVPLGFRGPYKSALLLVQAGESVDGTDTITLDAAQLYCTTIVSVRSHVAATGVSNIYAYATNVLTKTTAADTRDVLEILYL